ncbi:hypothetical protein ACU4GA_24195 [Methylobacterium oryzae CBMB20]
MFFICDVHNVHKSKGLGLLRGIGDIPLRVWNEEAARHPSGPLPPAELFVALCGEWEGPHDPERRDRLGLRQVRVPGAAIAHHQPGA